MQCSQCLVGLRYRISLSQTQARAGITQKDDPKCSKKLPNSAHGVSSVAIP
jgi:hypothetical protein